LCHCRWFNIYNLILHYQRESGCTQNTQEKG